MSAGEALSVHGISLPHYAAVKAAQAEGFRDVDVLKVEGIEPRRWARADPAWKVRLVDDPSVFAAYEVDLAAAEDWLDRRVSPIGEDVVSWAGFLSAFAAGGADLLSANDLRLSDVARLRRRWMHRIEQDPKLEERIAEVRKNPVSLPAIQVSQAALRPSRYARGRVEPAAVAPTADGRPEPALTLDRYAALCAEIAERSADASRALARYGISDEAALSALDRAWRGDMERDSELAADFRRLFAHNRARLSAEPAHGVVAISVAPETFGAAPPAIRAALRGTALVLDIPRGLALPFTRPVSDAPSMGRGPEPSSQPPRSAGLPTGTALALDVPRGEAMPFAKVPPGPADPPAAPRSKLAGTSAVVDVRREPALPFNTDPRAAPSPEVREAHPAAPPPPGPGTGTTLALDVPRGDALPFAHSRAGRPKLAETSGVVDAKRAPTLPFVDGSGAREREAPVSRPASKNKLGKLALSLDIPQEMRRARPEPVAAAMPGARPTMPVLTLEQYASLCVDISMSPGREAETLTRYRLTPEEKRALDGYYGERIAKDPALRRAWDVAYRTYHEWLRSSRRE